MAALKNIIKKGDSPLFSLFFFFLVFDVGFHSEKFIIFVVDGHFVLDVLLSGVRDQMFGNDLSTGKTNPIFDHAVKDSPGDSSFQITYG